MKKFTFEQFVKAMGTALADALPEVNEITYKEVDRSDSKHCGYVMHNENEKMSPIIYMEGPYDAYCDGMDFVEVLNKIVEQYKGAMQSIDGESIVPPTDWETVKDLVRIRAINPNNVDYLNDGDKVVYNNSELAFIVSVDCGDYSYIITNGLLESFEVSKEELFDTALNNTKNDVILCDMRDMLLLGMMGKEPPNLYGNIHITNDMLVLSNSNRLFGSGLLACEDVLESIADSLGGSYYIAPSSVHELIIINDLSINPEALEETIRSGNDQLEVNEVLGSTAMYYSKEKAELLKL